jgi:hypothetical protein
MYTDLIPAHEVTTPAATVEVKTNPFTFDAGVEVSVRVHTFEQRPDNPAEWGEDTSHTSHVGFMFNLTPDEADTLAAMLVAHAFDRRRALEQSAEPRESVYTAPGVGPIMPLTAGPTYAAPPMTSAEQAMREQVEA